MYDNLPLRPQFGDFSQQAAERALPASLYNLPAADVPPGFPMVTWSRQSSRYSQYWDWYSGKILDQRKIVDGQEYVRFPLRINFLRQLARKHAAALFGEIDDAPGPMVRPLFTPKKPFSSTDTSDEDRKLINVCQKIVSEIWDNSNSRSIMYEQCVLSQFLGGAVFQVVYEPWRTDLLIPIRVRAWPADMFLPIWRFQEYWDLEEAYFVTRIDPAAALAHYGISPESRAGGTPYSIYVEHWTRETVSVYVNGSPVTIDGKLYQGVRHPYGFVPVVYIPHLREGGFYGESHVGEIGQLMLEYNEKLADTSDAVAQQVDRQWFARNVSSKVTPLNIGGITAQNLGNENPSMKNPPEVWAAAVPNLNEAMVRYPMNLYDELLRESDLSRVIFGEDEGSQRSAATLAVRMFPLVAHIRMERSHWETGLNRLAFMMLSMFDTLNLWDLIEYQRPAPNFLRTILFNHQFAPQIPRDRESLLNEIILAASRNLMSPTTAIEKLGHVRDITREMNEIIEWMKRIQEVSGGAKQDNNDTRIKEPVAESPILMDE